MTGNTNRIKLAILFMLALLLVVAGPSLVFAQTGDGDVIGDDGLVDEVEIEDDDDDDNFFCASSSYEHPIAAAIARSYDVEYEDVMGWFCEDGLGLGQVALALHTAAVIAAQEADEEDVDEEDDEDLVDDEDEPVTAAVLLTMRLDGYGWGQIWQEYGFVGRPRGESMGLALGRSRHDVDDEEDVVDEDDVDDEDEVDTTETTGRPANTGRPDNPGSSNSNGHGRPDNPGSSNSSGQGRPDNPGSANKGGRK